MINFNQSSNYIISSDNMLARHIYCILMNLMELHILYSNPRVRQIIDYYEDGFHEKSIPVYHLFYISH